VVGAGGKMGAWFTNYFARRAMHVSAFDVKKGLQFSGNVQVERRIENCIRDADLVLVCVPVNATPQLVRECAKGMKAGAIIAEISSVKDKTFLALKHVRNDLQPLCIHPMFGPGANNKKNVKMLLIPVRNEVAERKIVSDLFENAEVKVIPNSRSHDRLNAIILGLTYFTNIAFAKVMANNDLALLKQVSGTTFSLQSILAESILADEPALILALIKENPFARKYIREYIKAALAVEKLAAAKSSESLETDLRKTKSKLQKRQDLQQSYHLLYGIMESLK